VSAPARFPRGEAKARGPEAPERLSAPWPAVEMTISFASGRLWSAVERAVNRVVRERLVLVEDAEREGESMELRRIARPDSHVAGEGLGLVWVRAPPELVMPEDDVRVVEHLCVPACGLKENRRLLLGGSGAVDRRVLHRHEVMEGDDGQEVSLPLSAGEECDEFALGSRRGLWRGVSGSAPARGRGQRQEGNGRGGR
jgi:hypothetical protein